MTNRGRMKRRERKLTPPESPSAFLLRAFARSPWTPGDRPISVRSIIEPDGEEWVWQNEWSIWGHPNMSRYSMGGSRRHPGGDTVVGWHRDRSKAEEQRRESLRLMNQIAVEVLAREGYRDAMRHAETMPI